MTGVATKGTTPTKRAARSSNRGVTEIPPHVVAAAAKIFQQRGYHRASVADIAAELGILKGSMYHYIETKHDLLRAVVHDPVLGMLGTARTIMASPDPPEAKIRAIFHAHLQAFASHYPHLFVYLNELHASEEDPELRRLSLEYRGIIRSILEEAQRRQAIDPTLDLGLATHAFFGLCNSTHRWFKPGRHSVANVAETYATIFLSGVRAGPELEPDGQEAGR